MNGTGRNRSGRGGVQAGWRSAVVLVLGALASALAFLLVHEGGQVWSERREGARADLFQDRIQRALDSAALGLETLAATPQSGGEDLAPLIWYEAGRDHAGLLAAARLQESDGRFRLLSPRTPVWMTRLLLSADNTILARAAQSAEPAIEALEAPMEVAPGHRLFLVAASPPGSGAPAGAGAAPARPVTLVLVDGTALLERIVAELPEPSGRLGVSDRAGPIFAQEGSREGALLPEAAPPVLRALRFAGAEWSLLYAAPRAPVSDWDWLAVPLLLAGLGTTVVLARRPLAGRRPEEPAIPTAAVAEASPQTESPAQRPLESPVRPPAEPPTRVAEPALAEPAAKPPAPPRNNPPPPSPPAEGNSPAAPNWADNPAEGFLEVDLERGLVRANRILAQLLGHADPADLRAPSLDLRRQVFVDPARYDTLVEALRRLGPVPDFEAELFRKDGSRIWVSIAAWPLPADKGRIGGFAGAVRDISARKAAEHALTVARDDAEARSRAKSEFLANMSHELRTPLNAILGFSEIMSNEMFGPIGSERYRQYANDIHSSGRHLLDLVNDVLDLSKIEAGRLELAEEPVDVEEAVREVARLLETRAADGGVRLGLELPARLPRLRADPRLLRQLLLNLLSNAVKFTPSGGEVTALARVEPSGDMVLAVRDTGLGMRPEDIPLALEPFGQVRGQVQTNTEGTGLGLPLAKSIAEAHQGTLTLESAPGAGTTAAARFPASRLVRG